MFPTLPHEHRHAAESRRARLDEIERNLAQIEKNSWEMRQRSSNSCNETNEEIIDLTRQQQQQQQHTFGLSAATEIPIEIMGRQQQQQQQNRDNGGVDNMNQKLKNSVDYIQSKALLMANSLNKDKPNAAEKLSASNNKLNYIYYFDNDHFGGY